MKISSLAILGLAQMFFAAGCPPADSPRLRADAPQGWKALTELSRDGLTIKVLAPAATELDAGLGVVCASAAEMPAADRFRSLVRQAREMTGAARIEVYDPAKKFFVLSYTYDSVSGEAYVGRVTVKTDSSGLGQTLVISGYWPEAAGEEMGRVYAAFAASVDFK